MKKLVIVLAFAALSGPAVLAAECPSKCDAAKKTAAAGNCEKACDASKKTADTKQVKETKAAKKAKTVASK